MLRDLPFDAEPERTKAPAARRPLTVTLVNLPTVLSNPTRVPMVQQPPLGIAYIAAALRQAGHVVRVIDGLGEGLDRVTPFRDGYHTLGLPIEEIAARVEPDTDVLGIGILFSGLWPLAKDVIRAVRARLPGVTVVCGGEHVTAVTDFVMADAPVDYAVVGEGEETICELADHLSGAGPAAAEIAGLAYRDADGGIVHTPRRRRRRTLDQIPWPAWDLFPIDRYIETPRFFAASQPGQRPMVILATRGCPYTCKFCSNEGMWGINYFMRDPVDVVDEMETYVRRYGVTDFHFNDLTPIINARWAHRLCDEIIARRLDITWKTASGTRSEALDLELLRKMRESGCDELILAPESGSPEILEINRKRVKLDKVLTVVRLIRDHGIDMRVTALMIVGFPEERLRDVARSWRYMARLARAGCSTVYVSRFMAYPGSEYHALAVRDGGIVHDDRFFLILYRNFGILNFRNSGYTWHPRWSARRICLFSTAGYAIFFATYYLLRPLETLGGVRNVLRNEPRSRLERFFANLIWQPRLRRDRTPAS